MTVPKLNVAICGGGIAGLTSAIALSKFSEEHQSIKIDVYESAPRFGEIGAGIAFWLRPWKILRKLGLDKDLEKMLGSPVVEATHRGGFEFWKADQGKSIPIYEFLCPAGPLGFHRAHFLDVLTSHLDQRCVTTHFKKRLVSYMDSDPGSPVLLEFADGSHATADILIACDGIHSVVRHQLLETEAIKCEAAGSKDDAAKLRASIEPVWTGMKAYRGVIPYDKLKEKCPSCIALQRPVIYNGKNKNIVAYPLSQRFVNFVGNVFNPSMVGTKFEGPLSGSVSSTKEVVREYEGWADEVQQLVQYVEDPKFWVVNNLVPLPIASSGRVALLGDAAHAMSPAQGSGAGQAIEDAYILARLLTHPRTTPATIPTALKAYEEVRLPHANKVLRLSALAMHILSYDDPRFSDLVDRPAEDADVGRLWELGHVVVDNWKWAWTTTIDDDEARAVKMLEDRSSAGGFVAH